MRLVQHEGVKADSIANGLKMTFIALMRKRD